MPSRPTTVMLGLVLLAAGCDPGPEGIDDDAGVEPGPDAAPPARTELCDPGAPPVSPNLFVDLGATSFEDFLYAAGERLVGGGFYGWRMWDADGVVVAAGDGEPLAASAGMVIVANATQISMCDGRDGHHLGTISADAFNSNVIERTQMLQGIAPDASYAWVEIDGRLLVLSPDGTVRFRVDGPFRPVVHAIGNTLYVEASDRVRIFDATTGAEQASLSVTGSLAGWFEDADRYITIDGVTARVHDVTGAVLATFELPSIAQRATGHGDVIAAYHANGGRILQISFFRIGAGAAPFAQVGPFESDWIFTTPSEIAVRAPGGFDLIRPGADAVERVHVEVPGNGWRGELVRLPHGWAHADDGVIGVLSGVPDAPVDRTYNHGRIRAIASAPGGPVLVATEAATIAFHPETRAELWRVAGDSIQAVMSADGTACALLTRDHAVELRDAWTGALRDQIPADPDDEIAALALSPDASVAWLARGAFQKRAVTHRFADDAEVGFGAADYGVGPPTVSPDGSRVAVPRVVLSGVTLEVGETALYDAAGAAIATVDGVAIGWRDSATLLVERDDRNDAVVAQVDAAGATIAAVTLAEAPFWRFGGADLEPIAPDRLYGRHHEIFELATGAAVPWPGAIQIGPTPELDFAASTGTAMVFGAWWGPVEWLPLPE